MKDDIPTPRSYIEYLARALCKSGSAAPPKEEEGKQRTETVKDVDDSQL